MCPGVCTTRALVLDEHVSSCLVKHDRIWSNPPHLDPETETEITFEENDVGGLGKYSHKDIGLSHHHWVEHVVSAGSFNVHCTGRGRLSIWKDSTTAAKRIG